MDDGEIMNFSIEQWDKISECFVKMFQGLGSIETTEEMLHFRSFEPYVATGISLSKQGKMQQVCHCTTLILPSIELNSQVHLKP